MSNTLLQSITKEELELFSTLCDPMAFAEIMFSDFDNLQLFNNKFGHIRNGQIPMLSFEYLVDDKDPNLTEKENFKLLEGAGTLHNYSARKLGKTLIGLILDMYQSSIFHAGWETLYSSYDYLHILGVLDKFVFGAKNHPIIKSFFSTAMKTPNYIINFKNGFNIVGINANVMSRNPGCFDDRVEILTDEGWKFFKDIEETEKVLTINPENKEANYKQISKKIEISYNGKMKRLKNKYTDFLVTPNHNFFISLTDGDKWKKLSLNEINYKQIYFPTTFKWKGQNKKNIRLSGIVNSKPKELNINMKAWVKFIAWYLSEGALITAPSAKNHYRIVFGQKNNCSEIEEDFDELGIHYNKKFRKHDSIWIYTFSNKLIFNHLMKYFGKYKNKRIAPYIKKLNFKFLNLFIDAYLKGDGHIRKKVGNRKSDKCIFSSVKILADDLQEVACKAGYRANQRYSEQICNGKLCGIYFIHLGISKNSVFNKDNIQDVDYNGKVYCVDVEPWHSIFVRCNGKILISGNSQYFGKHTKKLWQDETSKETFKVKEKRIDATSELGCIERFSGMTDFAMHSPAGDVFTDRAMRPWLFNVPQYISPLWDESERLRAIEKYNGEASPGYRIFVKGEVVTEGETLFDMDRVAKCVDEGKHIKTFEVGKEDFSYFKTKIIVDRPKGIDNLFICADIGLSAPTEIVIVTENNRKYRYQYNITLHNLTHIQQTEIFEWLGLELKANFIAVDATDGSIDKDEYVLVKIKGNMQYVQAKKLEKAFKNNKEILVPTWNDGKLEWKKSEFYKHFYEGKMLKLQVEPSSGEVKVTPNHSMMVYTEKGLVQKKAEDVVEGDWVVSPKTKNNEQEFCLDYITKDINQFVKGKNKKIKLDEELAYFLGWCVAEGCSKTTSYQLTLGDELEEAELLLKLSQKLFNLNSGYIQPVDEIGKKIIIKNRESQVTKIRYTVVLGGGKNLLRFIENLVGKGSHNKKIPMEILNSPTSVKLAFLKGLVEGDGHERNRKSKETIVKVASSRLVYDLGLLLKQLGIFVTFGENNEQGCVNYTASWTDNQLTGRWLGIPYEFIPLKSGKNRPKRKVYNCSDLKKHRISDKKINKIKDMLKHDFMFRKIKKITKYKYKDYVYDLMVQDNNTFVAGKGDILVHNTGRAIMRELENKFPKENLCPVSFQEKLVVDFEKEDDGKLIMKNGKPVEKLEYVSEWSVQHFKTLIECERMIFPIDYKLETQISSMKALRTGNRVIYRTIEGEDHLFQAFQTFAIVQFKNEFNINRPINKKAFSKTGC